MISTLLCPVTSAAYTASTYRFRKRFGVLAMKFISQSINLISMVHRPTRGDAPPRIGGGIVPMLDITNSTISADVYLDPMRYELEVENVFRKSWIITARSSELPNANDFVVYEGHGDTVIVTRQPDGSTAAFHNVCQHRGVRLTGELAGCTRRFTCPYHGWVYDTVGELVGVPERHDFDTALLEKQAMPEIKTDEWAGFVWINLAGPTAPSLHDWIGSELKTDLAGFATESMVLLEKYEVIVDVNYKAVVDAFNEVYHAVTLHHTGADWARAARDTSYHIFGPNSMSLVPRATKRAELEETQDHHQHAICHYVVFPTTIFNANPDQMQVFNPIPLGPEQTKLITWQLIYPASDDESDTDYAVYRDNAVKRWDHLKAVVNEDISMFHELAATKRSMAYRQNLNGQHDFKLKEYHRTVEHCIAGGSPMDRWGQEPQRAAAGQIRRAIDAGVCADMGGR
jgi:phenylpropionate dioxygenase-like ring-hydroxylating dioxygenase large terminal subunit